MPGTGGERTPPVVMTYGKAAVTGGTPENIYAYKRYTCSLGSSEAGIPGSFINQTVNKTFYRIAALPPPPPDAKQAWHADLPESVPPVGGVAHLDMTAAREIGRRAIVASRCGEVTQQGGRPPPFHKELRVDRQRRPSVDESRSHSALCEDGNGHGVTSPTRPRCLTVSDRCPLSILLGN